MQDDVANDPSNPFPGKLFNKKVSTPGSYHSLTLLSLSSLVASSWTPVLLCAPKSLEPRQGDNVTDVYDGCATDYRGSVVTADLFLKVITGDTCGSSGSTQMMAPLSDGSGPEAGGS